MFTYYKVSVSKGNWTALFIKDDQETIIKNDKGALERLLSKTNYLVGFNNYQFDDKVLASILRGLDIDDSIKRIKNNRFRMSLQNPITLDAVQEIRNIEIDEVRANLLQVIGNKNALPEQVKTIKEVFESRESYFSSKFEIVKDFELSAENVRRTRTNLAAAVLKSKPKTDDCRLDLKFDKRIKVDELPKEVIGFYKNIIEKYKSGQDFQTLEKERFMYLVDFMQQKKNM